MIIPIILYHKFKQDTWKYNTRCVLSVNLPVFQQRSRTAHAQQRPRREDSVYWRHLHVCQRSGTTPHGVGRFTRSHFCKSLSFSLIFCCIRGCDASKPGVIDCYCLTATLLGNYVVAWVRLCVLYLPRTTSRAGVVLSQDGTTHQEPFL